MKTKLVVTLLAVGLCSGLHGAVSQGRDGQAVGHPGMFSGWSTSEGSDGRLIAHPGMFSGWSTSEGSDGRLIAHPGIFSGWSTSEGSDGRLIAHPGMFSGWSTSEGSDGRLITYPNHASVLEGSNGRKIAYTLYTNDTIVDAKWDIVKKVWAEIDDSLDPIWILTAMGHLDEKPNISSAEKDRLTTEGYNAGFLACGKVVDATLTTYGATTFQGLYDKGYEKGVSDTGDHVKSFLDEEYNASSIAEAVAFARITALAEGRTTGIEEGQATGIEAVKANPAVYGLYTSADLNASIAVAVAAARNVALEEGKEQGQATGIAAVKAKPSDYGLFAAADVNASVVASRNAALAEGRTTGMASVKDAPSEHGLYTQADLNASAASARTAGIAEGRSAGVEEGTEQGRSEGQATGIAAVKADPSAHGLVTKDAYDLMVEQFINASDSTATPYTDGWFYHPNRGWMFTNRTAYPYFYDSFTQSWMYFKSGEDKPRFYDYGSKTWVTIE
jgi:flagellar biosynthesis/type III secretory pathway protein FliH